MRALVLSGGGSKGAYEVGVLKKWMAEDEVDYDLIAGSSVGAINAAVLCQVPKGSPREAWEKLNQLWLSVNTSKVRKGWLPFGMASALWKPSVYNSDPLHKWVRDAVDSEKVRTCGRKLRIVAVSWDSGESRAVDENEPDIASWVLASSAFPGMLSPIEIDGELWADGGLRDNTPLAEAVQAGATEVDIILCADPQLASPFRSEGKAVVPDLAFRAVDLMANEIMRGDLTICELKNEIEAYRKIALRVLKPKISLLTITGGGLDFNPKAMRELIELGYLDACALESRG